MRLIDADSVKRGIEELKQSPWYNEKNLDHFPIRKEAVEVVEHLCIDKEPTMDAVLVDDLCEKINEAHNEGYDVGYWAGRRDYEPKWIPVTERLPEEWRSVLGLIQFCDEEEPPAQQVLWYLGNGHWRETWRGDMIESAVTHWMPLPEAPKGERKDDESHPFADDVMMGERKDK